MITAKINEQSLKLIRSDAVADSIDYLSARFDFQSDDWDGAEKWAHFSRDGKVYDYLLRDDCIRPEDHLNLDEGEWRLSLHGNFYANGKVIKRITTNSTKITIQPSGLVTGEPFPELPATALEALAAKVEEYTDTTLRRETLEAEVSESVTRQLAQRTQLRPEFVNFIDKCTDKSKLYVLPDGMIYAYIAVEEAFIPYTNFVPSSVDYDGVTIYNEQGYKDGVKVSADGDSDESTAVATGFIHYPIPKSGLPPTIYIQGAELAKNANVRMYITQSGVFTTYRHYLNNGVSGTNTAIDNYFTIDTLGDKYYRLTPIANGDTSALRAAQATVGEDSYFRISLIGEGENLIITLDEEITPIISNISYKWASTGHAFVPADYEDRIITAEDEISENSGSISSLEDRVSDLEDKADNDSSVLEYVAAEAERVALEVLSKQNPNTFSFLAISDMHNMESGSASVKCRKALTHAGQAMSLIRQKANIDFAVNFGDWTWGEKDSTTLDMGRSEILNAVGMIYDSFRDIPAFYLKGNHDDLAWSVDGYFTATDTFNMISRRSTGAVFPAREKERGYFYRDFDDLKLRVVALNTVDSKGITYPVNLISADGSVESERTTIGRISATQMQWLADEALNMAGKDGWKIIFVSHHYLKLGYSHLKDSAGKSWDQGCSQVVTIMDAYTQGISGSLTTAYTGETVTFDFAGKNTASIIATFNGHLHNFKTGVQGESEIPWITIPNAFPGRDNERGQQGEYVFGEEQTYPKTENSAEDTAFCVITVDTAENKIYASHYGAGYDRVIEYKA